MGHGGYIYKTCFLIYVLYVDVAVLRVKIIGAYDHKCIF
jgi:hypothetical protein